MRSAPLNLPFTTLHTRLVVWNTCVVMLSVAVTLFAVREGLRLRLLYETEELLGEDAAELELFARQFAPDLETIKGEMSRKAIGHEQRGLFVELLDRQGEATWSSVNTPSRDDLEPRNRGQLRSLPSGGYTWVDLPVEPTDTPPAAIRVGCSLAHVREDIRRLTQLIVAVGAVLSLVSPFGGYWLASRATTPFRQIITTAQRLRPAQLDERLPNRGTRDELDQLSQTINALLDRIAEYLAKNREFVANAAHELRSPLAAIQSSVDVALNAERSPAEYQELLYSIVEACGDLGKLVNQLLLLAETDGGPSKLHRQPVRLDEVARRAVEMFRGAAEDQGVQLSWHATGPVAVEGDGQRLRQVVNNLIENALKFTSSGGRVSVSLAADAAQGEARLTVEDTGAGVAPADLPHIFERFYQGNKSRPRETHQRGAGLGLSICQAIVEAHGGRIEVASQLGQGARFVVTLSGLLDAESAPRETAGMNHHEPIHSPS